MNIRFKDINMHIKKSHMEDTVSAIVKQENISKEDAKEVQNIIIESGSLDYAVTLMNKLFKESRNRIINLNISEYVKNILLGFITYLEIREK